MRSEYLVGVDIGTGGTKTALFASDGSCLAESFEASDLRRPSAGRVEEDPEQQTASVARTINECIERAQIAPQAVQAIAIDGQMAGIIGVGADGRAITPYDSWLDTRCAPYIEHMLREAGQAILASTGNTPSFNHGPKVLWWMHEHPEVYRHVRAFVQPSAYAAMRMCGLSGGEAYIDTTYLHFSGFADNEAGRWNPDLLSVFRVDPSKMPAICSPHEVIGHISEEAAGMCGVPAGVPVAAGAGDTAASFLSCGAVSEGICVDVAGTASVFAATVGSFRVDHKDGILGIGRSIVPGLWHPYAYINGGGLNLNWFRDKIAQGALRIAGVEGSISLDSLSDAVAEVPLSEGLPIFVPHLSGRVMPAAAGMRGAWVGLDWSHGLPELYRSVLEGVALEYGIYLKTIRRLYPELPLQEVRVTGGGEKSGVWNKIKADVAGMPFISIVESHGAPMGSALLAGYASGLFDDLRTIVRRWIVTDARTEPDANRAASYAQRLKRYQRLLELLGQLSDPQ